MTLPLRRLSLAALMLPSLVSSLAFAQERAGLRYTPRPDEDRPMPISVTLGPQEGRLALKIVFDKLPWGDECQQRCANSTFFLDMDSNTSTGLQMGKSAPETGADLAITIQGVREYHELSGESRLRLKGRQFTTNNTRVDAGATFVELDAGRQADHLKSSENTVYALLDMYQADVPAGKRIRIVFHPPGGAPVQGSGPGMMATPTHDIFKP